MKNFYAKFLLAVLAFSAPVYLYADNNENDITACKKAVKLMDDLDAKTGLHNVSFDGTCDFTNHSQAEWLCVFNSLKNGNAQNYSTTQCLSKNISGEKTPDISLNANVRAVEICKNIALSESGKNAMPNFNSDICNTYSNVNNPAEWLCVLKKVQNGIEVYHAMKSCFPKDN